jgi:hypothetical protein
MVKGLILTGAIVWESLALLANFANAQPSLPSRHYGLVDKPIGTAYEIAFVRTADSSHIILAQDTIKQLAIGTGYDITIPTRLNPADSSLGGLEDEIYSFFINTNKASPDLTHNPGGVDRVDLIVTGVFGKPISEQYINQIKIAPNPGEHFSIKYSLAQDSKINLSIFNLLGQKMINLVDEKQGPGDYVVSWDGTANGRKLPNSVYLYRLDLGQYSKTGKLTLVR